MRYISCADTVKMIQSALKESFWFEKFYVKYKERDAGNLILVRWMDGPNGEQINSIIDAFRACSCKTGLTHKLLIYGEEVEFDVREIGLEREFSSFAKGNAWGQLYLKYGRKSGMDDRRYIHYDLDGEETVFWVPNIKYIEPFDGHAWLSQEFNHILTEFTWEKKASPSPTIEKIIHVPIE